MQNMRSLLLTIILFLSTSNAFAGWFRCHVYKGQIAGAKVHMYLQLRDINAESKDTIPISGVYKYDNYNEPIELRGVLIRNKTLELIEYYNNIPSAKMSLEWNESLLVGAWVSKNKSCKMMLNKINSLIDTEREGVNSSTEILMKSSFKAEYLVGLYYKERGDQRARLSELKVISKKTNEIKQVIKFNRDEPPTGNISTIIFEAIRVWENFDKGELAIEVEVEDGGHGGQTFFMTYNKDANRFIKD